MKYNIIEMVKSCLPELKDGYEYLVRGDIEEGGIGITIRKLITRDGKKAWETYSLIVDKFVDDWKFEYIDFEIPKKYLKITKENNYDK